tara:strand:+ start:135 stop:926 length:792 start_codon:yes stop_codon:yes gene_type:complete
MKIIYPKNLNKKKIEDFFIKIGLRQLVIESKKKIPMHLDHRTMKIPQPPDLNDLYRLYMFIILNKRTTVLEFGTGYSTLVMHYALMENQKKFGKIKPFPRCENPYEIFTVDNNKFFSKISKNRIKQLSKKLKYVNFFYSRAQMTKYQGNFAVEYERLPRVNPDFIYLDGPSQWAPKNSVNNFTTAHPDMMPMSCDIAKIENFLTPSTIIVSDGRTANSIFLKNCFKRNWNFYHDKVNDQCYFLLNEKVLGQHNHKQISFYNKR